MTTTVLGSDRNAMWVIIKGGYYYRPKARGYTASALEAGLFSEEDAMQSAAHAKEVTCRPFLEALYGAENLFFDRQQNLFWNQNGKETWPADEVSLEPYMVQAKKLPYRFPEPQVTADEVRQYREETGAGMMEAKQKLRGQRFAASMAEFKRKATLEEKVDYLLDRIAEREAAA